MEDYSITEIDYSFPPIIFSLIGLRYEKISFQYLQLIFKEAEIVKHPRLYPDKNDESKYIIPDVMIKNPSKNYRKLYYLKDRQPLLLDFKRSISAVFVKDLNYLTIFPQSKIIFCFLIDNNVQKSWKNYFINLLNTKGKQNKKEIKEILKRIIIWTAKGDFIKNLPVKIRSKYLLELQILEKIKNTGDIQNTCIEIFNELKLKSNQELTNDCKTLLNLEDPYSIFKSLLILQVLVQSKFCAREDISKKLNFSLPTIDNELNRLIMLNIIDSKRFFKNKAIIYFHRSMQSPNLIDYVKSYDLMASLGLELIVKIGIFNRSMINELSFEDIKTVLKLKKNQSIHSVLKILSFFDTYDFVVPNEVHEKLGLSQSICAELLRSLCSIKLLESYKIEWESTVVYYRLKGSGPSPFRSLRKYLPKLTNFTLYLIEERRNITFSGKSELMNTFGSRWNKILQVYAIIHLNQQKKPNGYTPEDLMEILELENIKIPFEKLRKWLFPLSNYPFNLLSIERENTGKFGKIKRFILETQNKEEYRHLKNLENEKNCQINKGIVFIQNQTGLTKKEIRSNLKNGWSTKVRIFYILQTTAFAEKKKFSPANVNQILENNGIKLSRKNIIRYLSPLGKKPFCLLTIVRSKQGEYSPIKYFLFNNLKPMRRS